MSGLPLMAFCAPLSLWVDAPSRACHDSLCFQPLRYEFSQQIDELTPFLLAQSRERFVGMLESNFECSIDKFLAPVRQLNGQAPAITRVGMAFHKPSFLQPVQPVGHRPGRKHGRFAEF
jgi:hypothetical protein